MIVSLVLALIVLLLLLLLLVPVVSLIPVSIRVLFVPGRPSEIIPIAALAIIVSLHIVLNCHSYVSVCLCVNTDALITGEALVELYPPFDLFILSLPFYNIC